MSGIKYEIVKKIGVLNDSRNGWTREVNIVKWNDREPKLDIRDWNHDDNKVGKGITLNHDEKELLLELLQNIEI